MRPITLVLGIALLSTGGCAGGSPSVTLPDDPGTDLAELFAYEPDPVDMVVSAVRPGDGHETLDITYAGRNGSRVEAFLVVPGSPGPHAGVVFMHQGAGNRSQFFGEATALADGGFVSLLVGIPWAAELDRFTDAVVGLRRGADLLSQRDDVDPGRLGYVGHSWGATFGTILAAIDRRFQAYALMAGVDSLAGMLGDEALRPFDSGPYLASAPPAPMLFQYGEKDSRVTPDIAKRLFDLAGDPKELRAYATDHNFQDEDATADRRAWLVTHLGG